MNNEKLQDLKLFSQEHTFHNLVSIKNELPDNFLSPLNLQTKNIIKDKINKILNCSSSRAVSTDLDKNSGELKKTILYDNACGQYVACPICSRTRADTIKMKYGESLDEAIKNCNKDHVYFITFTLDNRDSFEDMYQSFNKAIRAFLRMGQNRKGKFDNGEASKIKAAIMGIEAIEGDDSKKWHVHGHMLAFCDSALDFTVYDQKKKKKLKKFYPVRIPKKELDKIALNQIEFNGEKKNVSKLSYEWFKATEGKAIDISIKFVSKSKSFGKQINEIVKYPTKLKDLPKGKLLELLCNKDRKRFLRVYGSLRGKGYKEKPIQDEENKMELYSIDTRKYDFENHVFTKDDNDLNSLARELNNKRDQLKDFLSKCTKARIFKNELMKYVKQEVKIKTLLDPDYKQSVISEINSIHDAFKVFIKALFNKIVKYSHLKNYSFSIPVVSSDINFIINGFLNLKLV